jgi:hypothetical protein
VPSFGEVADQERLLLPPRISANLLPLRLLPLEDVARSPGQLDRLMKASKGEGYMLAVQGPERLPLHAALADQLWTRCVFGCRAGRGGSTAAEVDAGSPQVEASGGSPTL